MGKLPRVCLLSATLVLGWVVLDKGWSYWEGQSFQKSWILVILVPFGLMAMGAFFTYLVTVALTFFSEDRWQVLLAVLLFPVVWFGAYQLLPDFTDGMSAGLQRKIRPERLRRFAEIVNTEAMKQSPAPSGAELVKLMKRDFPDIRALSPLEPSVARDAGYVRIFWGSPLMKHWGIQIGSRPFAGTGEDYRQGVSSREVFDGIWVYHD